MSQQFLDDAHVRTPLEEVRGEGMAQGVQRDPALEPGGVHARGEQACAALACEPAAPLIEEEGRPADLRREHRSRARDVGRHGIARERSQRYLALLPALAEHAHEALLEVHVVDVEPDQLRDPQPCSVEDLEDRVVPEPDGCRDVGGLEQPDNLLHRQRVREGARELGLHQCGRGIAIARALPEQEPMERSDGRQRASDGSRAVRTLLVAPGRRGDRSHERTDRRLLDVLGHDDVALRAERRVSAEVAAIRGERVGGESAFDGEMVEVPVGPHHERVPHRPQAAQPGPSTRESSGVDDMPCASATPWFVT